jgi:hypothetical protein
MAERGNRRKRAMTLQQHILYSILHFAFFRFQKEKQSRRASRCRTRSSFGTIDRDAPRTTSSWSCSPTCTCTCTCACTPGGSQQPASCTPHWLHLDPRLSHCHRDGSGHRSRSRGGLGCLRLGGRRHLPSLDAASAASGLGLDLSGASTTAFQASYDRVVLLRRTGIPSRHSGGGGIHVHTIISTSTTGEIPLAAMTLRVRICVRVKFGFAGRALG